MSAKERWFIVFFNRGDFWSVENVVGASEAYDGAEWANWAADKCGGNLFGVPVCSLKLEAAKTTMMHEMGPRGEAAVNEALVAIAAQVEQWIALEEKDPS